MKVDTRMMSIFAKKYALLVLVVLISIAIGSLAYSVGVDANNKNSTNDKLVNKEVQDESNLEKITLEDIITKNKVVLEKLEVQKETIPYETIALGRSKEGTVKTLLICLLVPLKILRLFF